MPLATALITALAPDLTPAQRRIAEDDAARGVPGFDGSPDWPRRYAHGTLFRANEADLLALAADGRFALAFQLRVYPDAEGLGVRVGTREVSPLLHALSEEGASPEPGEVQGGPDAWSAREGAGPEEGGAPGRPNPLVIRPGEPWNEWIVQLWSPPNPDVVAVVAGQGLRIVGTVGRFGLHVRTPLPVPHLPLVLPDVRWVARYHPLLRVQPELLDAGLSGMVVDRVAFLVDPPEALGEVRAGLAALGADLGAPDRSPPLADGAPREVVVKLLANRIPAAARLPGVTWVRYAPRTPKPESEGEAQVVAGNIHRQDLAGPSPGRVDSGYRRWLHAMDLSGAGATIAICDTGVAWNQGNARRSAPDLDRRQVAAFDYTNGQVQSDTWGHGTHIAGLAVGSGIRDSSRVGAPLSLGLGVAPGASYVTQNAIAEPTDPDRCSWWPATSLLPYTRDASRAGATILTMAWTTDGLYVGQGYVPLAAELDALVRDPADTGAPGGELVVVGSAGNVWNAGPTTITPPKEAKNIVVVGASTQADDPATGGPDGIATFSARGPALDGRILPTVVAPGVGVVSTLSRTAEDPQLRNTAVDLKGFDATAPEDAADAEYASLSGTSMSVGLVAGACAILDEWWRAWGDTGAPGAALTRALLVIGADDLSIRLPTDPALDSVRPGPIPDPAQGWGRVNLGNIVCQAPRSPDGVKVERRRGPKRVERAVFHLGDTPHRRRYAKARADLPVRATLAWTDPPGSPGKSPALCNDLDLVVSTPDGTLAWSGNHFQGGWSALGRAPSPLDNLECVFLQDAPDVLTVSVEPTALTADARPPFSLYTPWQDYALVLENLVPVRGDARAIALLDRSARMGTTGALAALGLGWQGFIRGLRRGDALGLVRFDDNGERVMPPPPTRDLPRILAPGDDDLHCAAVAGTPAGSDSQLTRGLAAVRTAEKAPVVLLSDGAFTDAVPALSAWAVRAPIHTVGLWPVAAEATLRRVAGATHGRYLYAPTEALLGAAMAELRAELTGDPVVRSESVSVGGPSPRATLAIPVEDGAEGLLVAITWGDASVRGVQGPPEDEVSLGIGLRTPDGHRLPAWSSVALVNQGPGSVHLEIGPLRPGRWVVELQVRRPTPLVVHVAASVPTGPRLRARFWPPRPRTGTPLRVIARWDGIGPVDPTQANVSGEVERPFAKAALNAAHRRVVNGGSPVPAAAGGKVLRARGEILRHEGVDIFTPLTEGLDFRWVAHAADGAGPGWEAVIPVADLPYTWSAQVSGWVIGAGGRRFVRAARASTTVAGPALPPRIVEPDAPQGGAPTRGPWFRPGEEIDIDASGFTARTVWYADGTSNPHAATGGGAHYRAADPTNSSTTLGHLVCLGAAGNFFPLRLTPNAPTNNPAKWVAGTGSTSTAEAYPTGRDNWMWPSASPWPPRFDLVPGDWSPPKVNDGVHTLYERALDGFPATGSDNLPDSRPTGANSRLYRVQRLTTGSSWTTIAYVVWNAPASTLTWYAEATALSSKAINGVTKRVLAGPAGSGWRFRDQAAPDSTDANRIWVKLAT